MMSITSHGSRQVLQMATIEDARSAAVARSLGAGQLPLVKRCMARVGKHPSAWNYDSLVFVYGFCRRHGYFVDYVHCWPNHEYIQCPECLGSTAKTGS
jgi:hypothetical protein